MINLINIVPVLLMLSCNCSTTPGKIKKDLANKSSDSLQIVNSTTQTTGKLQTDTITITVSYAALECGCPQWFETKFKQGKFLKNVERFYLEPTNKTLVNANNLWDGQALPLTLKLVGRFSKDKELPQTYNTKTTPEKARIFWYDKIVGKATKKERK